MKAEGVSSKDKCLILQLNRMCCSYSLGAHDGLMGTAGAPAPRPVDPARLEIRHKLLPVHHCTLLSALELKAQHQCIRPWRPARRRAR